MVKNKCEQVIMSKAACLLSPPSHTYTPGFSSGAETLEEVIDTVSKCNIKPSCNLCEQQFLQLLVLQRVGWTPEGTTRTLLGTEIQVWMPI